MPQGRRPGRLDEDREGPHLGAHRDEVIEKVENHDRDSDHQGPSNVAPFRAKVAARQDDASDQWEDPEKEDLEPILDAGGGIVRHYGESNDAAPGIQDWFQVLLFWVLPLIGSIILARRNLRAKRGDIRGALVVGISIVILYLLYHLIPMSPEVGPFAILVEATGSASLGHALVRGVTMLLAYLAIEPYIRRLWPSVLVSWARLVAGRLRDPIIGRDVLVGAAAGAALPFVFTGAHSMEQALGFQVDPARLSTALLGTVISAPSVLAIVSLALALGVFRATTFYTILLILRFVLRNNRLAAIAALALFVLALSDYSSKSLWLDILVSLFAWGGVVWVAVRFGYVASTFIILVSLLVDVLPWTLDFSSWVAPQTMFAWGIMAVLLGYGFLTAVGGKSLFSDPLSDPVA